MGGNGSAKNHMEGHKIQSALETCVGGVVKVIKKNCSLKIIDENVIHKMSFTHKYFIPTLKRIGHSKTNILSLIIHPYVVPNT